MIKPLTTLRFIMAIVIFISHLTLIPTIKFDNFLNNGGYGVIFFFILSGFVIAINYKDKFQSITKQNWFDFVKKRVKKIYPLYIFTIILGFLCEIIANSNIWSLQYFIKQGVKLLLCIPMMQTLIPNMAIAQAFNEAAWFLSCLFIIYMITPIILKLLYPYNRNLKKLFIIMFAAIVVLCLLLYGVRGNLAFRYCSPYIRVFYYFIGMILGMIFINTKDNIKNRSNKLSTIVEVISIISFVLGWILLYNKQYSEITSILIFVSLIYIFALEKGKVSEILSKNIGVFLGKISFEFYLIHYPLIKYLGNRIVKNLNVNNVMISIIMFVISIILATMVNSIQNRKPRKNFL